MRLRRLDLIRYGKFTDGVIDFGAAKPGVPDLHIVYGLNEAGKSTALSAYLDLLFGIENTSRYGFLHPYASMQVGGRLEFSGGEHDLVRVKTRANSLLDGKGQPINEALLSVPLAGLTRETYRTMFSLDDQTLEDGGNAIIASKGELGELLFAASTGLADLGSMLTQVRDGADAIYKQRGRSTEIAELKKALVQLKADRDAVDTLASAHAGLVAALEQAEAAYEEAVRQGAAAKARQNEIARILRAAPLAGEHGRLTLDLAQYDGLPLPPAGWAAELPRLMTETVRLRTQVDGTEADLLRLDAETAEIVVDEAVLALSARIATLGEHMARFSTAESDLPRRHASMREHEAGIARMLVALGQAGHERPETLPLPAALVGTLRDLIETRSGIEAKVSTAQRELALAQENFERASAETDQRGPGDKAVTPIAMAGIEAALGTLRRSNHQARMLLAERALPQVSRRWHAQVDGLAPWSGDGDALRAMALPQARQVEAWRARANAIDKRRMEHGDKTRELVTRQREDAARIAAILSATGAIDDAEALRRRAARDAAWAAHGKALDAMSAAVFAEALAADDTLVAARLAHAQNLAELRSLQQGAAVTAVNLERQNELSAEADVELAGLAEEIESAVPDMALPKGGGPGRWIEHIEMWARQRQEALAAWDALVETEGDLTGAKADLARDVAGLVEALQLAGLNDVDDLSPNGLMQTAEMVVSEGNTAGVTQAAAQKALAERERDVQARERGLKDAETEGKAWRAAWIEALGQTWFTDSGVGAVRETLEALAGLPAALGQREDLARRIETMERDRADFAVELREIAAALGEHFDGERVGETAKRLEQRFEAAEQGKRLLGQKSKERQRLVDNLRAVRQELSAGAARQDEMTGLFGVTTLDQVSAALERGAERARLLERISVLGGQLASEMRLSSVDAALEALGAVDLGALEQEAAEVGSRLDDLEARSRELFAERSRAQDRLDAIGGDDAVARIEAQRRTVLLEIEDRAMTYLRLKTGALLAEKALRAYREKHRSSMMERASDAFALITRGDYRGLAAQPGKDSEVLIGLTRQGASKQAADMSKGTQFQLYLALRLAGYQEFALSRPSVPFIADDIMETFDEPRSEEVFRLLGQMAGIGQVIYLTHHRHLCTIAKSVVPSVTIHEIGGS